MAEQESRSGPAYVSGATNLKAAIKTAREFFVETVETLAGENELLNVHFEEVERADNGDWLITFGYDRKASSALARLGIPDSLTERVYRQVRIDKFTGVPQAITMRNL